MNLFKSKGFLVDIHKNDEELTVYNNDDSLNTRYKRNFPEFGKVWYLLDEIDAALDFKNVTKLSFQLKYRVKNSQIFVITLRNNMILTVNHIFGIYRSKKTSSIMSLRM